MLQSSPFARVPATPLKCHEFSNILPKITEKKTQNISHVLLKKTMRERCSYSEFSWSVFSRIWSKYGHLPISVFSPDSGKYGTEKLRIRTGLHNQRHILFKYKFVSYILGLNKAFTVAYRVYTHKKRKYSLETRAVLIEIWNYFEIYHAAQTTGDHFKKTWLSLKGNSYLQVIFRANLDKTNADMVQFIKRWDWEWVV